jgi:hypothetical protein
MTSTTADPRPIDDQGQAPTHPQPTGSKVMAEALRCSSWGPLVSPAHLIRDAACPRIDRSYEETGS